MDREMKKRMADNLDRIYERYNHRRYVDPDPLLFLYDYTDVIDREVAAMVASSLAFGGVKQIMRSVGEVLDVMGERPAEYLLSSGPFNVAAALKGFKHRWISGNEVAALLDGIRGILQTYQSIENCFHRNLQGSRGDMVEALSGFVSEIGIAGMRKGFLPDSCGGSACKRLNLFLRWMVREDGVDPGGWKKISAAQLIIPLDVHMYRLSCLLGFTSRNQKGMKTALEITRAFSEFSPDDPVKYDFALTRLGIRCDHDRLDLIEMLKGCRESESHSRGVH